MIKNASDLDFKNKKFVIIVGGVAGIGKTTTGLSSPKPLLIDLDKGVSRVKPQHRTDTAEVEDYQELIDDLESADLSNYETIVIDTGGKLLEMLKPVVAQENLQNVQRDGSLTLKGYGAIKRKFKQFTEKLMSFNKHIVYLFHATEVPLANNKDVTGLRIRMEGGAKDDIWDDVDIGGFIEIINGKRTIGFSNCDRYYAKATHGVEGLYELPVLTEGVKNTFLTDLIENMTETLNGQTKDYLLYEKVMELKPVIEHSQTLEQLNRVLVEVQNATHYLTSKEELGSLCMAKAKELGFKYDKATKSFVSNT